MPAFEVFYDGECPLCRREISVLRRLDRHKRLRFTDIAAPTFDALTLNTTYETLMAQIHGRRSDGTWVTGVDVFRELYAAVGLGFVSACTRLPGIRQLLDVVYAWFARHRLRLTGRCDNSRCARA